MVLGRRSAKVARKRVLSAQTRFGAPRTRKNVVTYEKVRLVSSWSKKSSNGATLATWSVWDEKVRSSVGNFPSRIALAKSGIFSTFPKNKNVTKTHFCVLAYVYDVFWCSEGSESQSCVLSALERLGAPKSPKSDFFIRVRRFCVF